MSDETITIKLETHINNVNNLSTALGFIVGMEPILLDAIKDKKERKRIKAKVDEMINKFETNLRYTTKEGGESMKSIKPYTHTGPG